MYIVKDKKLQKVLIENQSSSLVSQAIIHNIEEHGNVLIESYIVDDCKFGSISQNGEDRHISGSISFNGNYFDFIYSLYEDEVYVNDYDLNYLVIINFDKEVPDYEGELYYSDGSKLSRDDIIQLISKLQKAYIDYNTN